MSLLLFALLLAAQCAFGSSARPPNVLFIVADDLRAELNYAYNATVMITPNLDKARRR
jgi:hypothetical protein